MEKENEVIASVLGSFIEEMNKWEVYCDEVDQNKDVPYEKRVEMQKMAARKIFETYCTQKDRKGGRPEYLSWGHEGSYDYDPSDEKIIDIDIAGKKAVVETARETPMKKRFQYTLKFTNDQWLIDAKKMFNRRTEKWKKAYL